MSLYIQAAERFAHRFADLLGTPQHCQSEYDRLALDASQLRVEGGDLLGRGEFGVVALARFCAPAQHPGWARLREAAGTSPLEPEPLVAVKTLLSMDQGESNFEAALPQILLEARLLAVMDHPHLVRLIGVSEQRLPVQLVMEYCSLGNLLQFLRRRSGSEPQAPSLPHLADLAAQAAAGVEYLHAKLCVHRDLAARNLLLAPDATHSFASGVVVKLGDLGLARLLRTEADYYRVGGD